LTALSEKVSKQEEYEAQLVSIKARVSPDIDELTPLNVEYLGSPRIKEDALQIQKLKISSRRNLILNRTSHHGSQSFLQKVEENENDENGTAPH
jgi:hypothetical protein